MDKIKELIERVRLTPEDISKLMEQMAENMGDGDTRTYAERVAQAQLNKVLNDPDLALIDRKKQFNDNPYFAEKYKVSSGYLPVIPLAEAIKEVQDV